MVEAGRGRMSTWMLLCVGSAMQWAVIFLRIRRYGRGRILTRPISRRVRVLRDPLACRVAQWLVFFFAAYGAGGGDLVYWIPWTLVHLDDWVTGGDDDWRRLLEGGRNRVKWLMELPPVPKPGEAA